MIFYSNEGIGPFALGLFLQLEGSVVHKALLTALLPACLAAFINHLNYSDARMTFDDFRADVGGDTIKASQLWGAMGATLVFLIGFRTNKAYARFWDGTTLLHQMWGEWFDAASCLVAFTTLSMRDRKGMALDFRHTLVRLVSLLHASALEEISMSSDSEYGYPCLDIGNLDQSSLQYLKDCKFDKNMNFNRVEVIIHMIQTLVVHNHDTGIIKIPPPILSRVFQTLSRGQVNLANCKKITTTLFPFPYAQLIAFLLLVYFLMTPVIMGCICEKAHWAFIFTLVPVFGVSGLNYVARELEMPFGDDPNDLPLMEFQEHMNNSMLMLIRYESDHVPHTSPTCDKEWDTAKHGISDKRPKHFIDPERESSGIMCSMPLAKDVVVTPQKPTKAQPAESPKEASAQPTGAPAAAAKEAARSVPPKELSPAPLMEPTHRALEQLVQTITKELTGIGKALMTCADKLGTQLSKNDHKKTVDKAEASQHADSPGSVEGIPSEGRFVIAPEIEDIVIHEDIARSLREDLLPEFEEVMLHEEIAKSLRHEVKERGTI